MILALQTADRTTHAWLLAEHLQPTPSLQWESGRSLADQLLGRLVEFLSDHHATLADLNGLIIFSGPGSFTSLRIGHATVNALADALNIPVVGARGEDWRAHGQRQLSQAVLGRPALPYYGADAHITAPGNSKT